MITQTWSTSTYVPVFYNSSERMWHSHPCTLHDATSCAPCPSSSPTRVSPAWPGTVTSSLSGRADSHMKPVSYAIISARVVSVS